MFTGLSRALLTVRAWLVRWGRGEPVMLGLGIATGLGTGLLAAALIAVIRIVQRLAFGEAASPLEVVLIPTVSAFLVGVLLTYVFSESSGSGVIQTMTAVAVHGGRMRKRVPLGGVITSGLAIGGGASGGREGPIVLIGGGIASFLARLFALDEERTRTLIGAGAAAGIGASFNAPIGGMLFASELIVGGLRTASLKTIVLAAVVGSVVARELVGTEIIYEPAQSYALRSSGELGLYIGLGLAAALIGLALLYGEDWSKRLFARLRASLWRPLTLAAGGLGVGLVALLVPEVLGTGENLPPIQGIRDPVQSMFDGRFGTGSGAAGLLLVLLVAKLVATCVSIGSGNAIGTFAPALFLGAALGGAFGALADQVLPGAAIQPGAFALVGSAAVFGAAARAPLTAIVIVFELTNDYGLVLPLILATGIATIVAERLQPESVYTYPLRKKGIIYAEPESIDITQTVQVGEIMTTEPDTVPASMLLGELTEAFARTGHHGFPVLDGDQLVGVVTLSDLSRASGDGLGRELTAADVCTREPLTVTPGDPVFRALRRMAMLDVGRLPVVAADDRSRLVGLVRRADVVEAYRRALTRSVGAQQRRHASRLRDLVGIQLLELVIAGDAAIAGRKVRDVSWPQRTILTGIRRGGELIMPNGDTVLRAGDEVTVLTDITTTDHVRTLMTRTCGWLG